MLGLPVPLDVVPPVALVRAARGHAEVHLLQPADARVGLPVGHPPDADVVLHFLVGTAVRLAGLERPAAGGAQVQDGVDAEVAAAAAAAGTNLARGCGRWRGNESRGGGGGRLEGSCILVAVRRWGGCCSRCRGGRHAKEMLLRRR